MNMHDAAGITQERGGAERALRWIGDLDHPFYSDERNRFVWYEASAIAFQLLFLSSYFMTALVLIIGGGAALPYALTLFAPTLITAVVFQSYLKRNSAEYWPGRNDLVRRRGQLGVAAGVILLIGLIRAVLDLQVDGEGPASSFLNGAAGGALVGLIVGALAAIAGLAMKRNQQESATESDEF